MPKNVPDPLTFKAMKLTAVGAFGARRWVVIYVILNCIRSIQAAERRENVSAATISNNLLLNYDLVEESPR